MSLPPAQERVLDAMAEDLRSSEPRLTSMFAIFTRLTKNEAAPRREQLPPRSLRRMRLPRVSRRLRTSTAASGPRGGTAVGRHRSSAPDPGRRRSTWPLRRRQFWLHVLIASPLAIAVVIVGLVFGLGKHAGSPGCTTMTATHAASAQHARNPRCPYPADLQPGMYGKLQNANQVPLVSGFGM